ncbi:alpha/beta fold hydrolase [Bradyrhizobium sp. AZCC 2289]|uniref:alpha/beta fold hydrolase n=1 Tax=Bradyrhizobium sp. AZCC 2289 TaxID=3117026 RepID=UPI002FF39C87
MAKDLRELMRALKIDKIALVGHDRGARVATRFAKDHSDAIDRLVVVDNVPTRIVARDFNFSKMAKTYWLFLFHLKLDLPEIFKARSRCAPARCAGARAERPVAMERTAIAGVPRSTRVLSA